MTKDKIERFIKENEPHPLHDSARSNSLKDFIDIQTNESFSDILLRFIRESGMTEVECYKAAGITAQHFSKIRSNRDYQPTKETVLALAVALKLDLPKTKDLLRAGGLAFTHASKTDMIVEYYIINRNWNLFEINEVLDSYGLKPLGC
ncbi:MAG: helix-turn-helix transcriptional regulator [Spirochaetales bacterium]|nr:helix-turn-helix transcriptional regulator [Spirochaetales bacterium]